MFSAILLLGLVPQTVASSTARVPTPAAAPTSSVVAIRAARPPLIDGRASDEVWRAVPAITAFREARPTEDAEPKLATEARVAYDERNLYVLVRAFDAHPDSIVRRLARRDADVSSDWITLYVDSYHDRRTGFRFAVNPAGVKQDGVLYNDGDEDWAWDGGWEATARVDSAG